MRHKSTKKAARWAAKNTRVRPPKLKVKKGDRVRVLTGQWVGAEGVVRSVDPNRQRIIVEGVNIVHRHVRQSQKYQRGGVIDQEAPIHVSNVRVIEADS